MTTLNLIITVNPLVTDPLYKALWRKFDIKKRRDHRKNSYERRAYESVDDRATIWL